MVWSVCVLKERLVSSVSLRFMCLVFCYVSPHQLQYVDPSQWYPVCVLFPQCVILLVRASPEGLPPSFCGCHIYPSRCVTCSYKSLAEWGIYLRWFSWPVVSWCALSLPSFPSLLSLGPLPDLSPVPGHHLLNLRCCCVGLPTSHHYWISTYFYFTWRLDYEERRIDCWTLTVWNETVYENWTILDERDNTWKRELSFTFLFYSFIFTCDIYNTLFGFQCCVLYFFLVYFIRVLNL